VLWRVDAKQGLSRVRKKRGADNALMKKHRRGRGKIGRESIVGNLKVKRGCVTGESTMNRQGWCGKKKKRGWERRQQGRLWERGLWVQNEKDERNLGEGLIGGGHGKERFSMWNLPLDPPLLPAPGPAQAVEKKKFPPQAIGGDAGRGGS